MASDDPYDYIVQLKSVFYRQLQDYAEKVFVPLVNHAVICLQGEAAAEEKDSAHIRFNGWEGEGGTIAITFPDEKAAHAFQQYLADAQENLSWEKMGYEPGEKRMFYCTEALPPNANGKVEVKILKSEVTYRFEQNPNIDYYDFHQVRSLMPDFFHQRDLHPTGKTWAYRNNRLELYFQSQDEMNAFAQDLARRQTCDLPQNQRSFILQRQVQPDGSIMGCIAKQIEAHSSPCQERSEHLTLRDLLFFGERILAGQSQLDRQVLDLQVAHREWCAQRDHLEGELLKGLQTAADWGMKLRDAKDRAASFIDRALHKRDTAIER